MLVIILKKYTSHKTHWYRNPNKYRQQVPLLLDIFITSSTQINFLTASAVPWNQPADSPGICVAASTYLMEKYQ
jgi:hypothetical protein